MIRPQHLLVSRATPALSALPALPVHPDEGLHMRFRSGPHERAARHRIGGVPVGSAVVAVFLALAAMTVTTSARAQPREVAGFSDPPPVGPGGPGGPGNPDDQVVPMRDRDLREGHDGHLQRDTIERPETPLRDSRDDSPVRASVGTVGRVNSDAVRPGLMAALDFGRGPAGFRMSAAWVRVGYDDPLAQYTGELTLGFPLHSAFRPVFGVGGGLARTYRIDAMNNHTSGGSNLGVGIVRAGVEYHLPFTEADARASIGATATLPAIRANDAPKLDPWLLLGAAVTIGF